MKQPKIWLLGASFETSNMGLSALAESSLMCIVQRWPQAMVVIPTHNQDTSTQYMNIMQQELPIKRLELWYGRNIFKHQNIYGLFFVALLAKLLPFLRNWLQKINPSFAALMQADMVADITGGDSFTDLYRLPRLIRGNLLKYSALFAGKPLILLPQTYGPFKGKLATLMFRNIIKHAAAIYSRDQAGMGYVAQHLGTRQKILQFSPDVAFVLPASAVDTVSIQQIMDLKQQGKKIIGININGLLYSGKLYAIGEQAVKSDNPFKLQANYRELMQQITQQFLHQPDTAVVLVSHVTAAKNSVESDPAACEQLYQELKEQYKGRIICAEADLDHKQVKYLISFCDFFIGARMHACIAALSQAVPAVGLAYSDKFTGVFASVGMGDTVVDLRAASAEKILDHVATIYLQRATKVVELHTVMPQVRQQVLQLFASLPDDLILN
jgi:colanic acid/amylovoran biosynthesis protein